MTSYLTSALQRSELPAPLVPGDVDLRGLRTMPLDCDALLASDLMALATAEEGWAALKLWCRTWQNSGRLTDDDRVLAGYACAGDRKQWAKVKAVAMRGFVLCKDGNWYHETISPLAISAWEARCKYRSKRANDSSRMEKWRESKRDNDASHNAYSDAHVTRHERVLEPSRDTPVTAKRGIGIGIGIGKGKGKEQQQEQRAQDFVKFTDPVPDPENLSPNVQAARAMVAAGLSPTQCNPQHPALAAALAEGVTPEQLAELVRRAPPGRPMAWAIATARGQLADSKTKNGSGSGAIAPVRQADHSKTMAEVLRGQG